MERFVIVRSNRLNTFGNHINSDNRRVINMFRDENKKRILEKEIRLLTHLNLPERLFNPQLVGIDEENIIVFDGHVRIEFLKWLLKNNPKKRIILWLWNTVEEVENNLKLDKIPKGIEVWSYSEYDCKKNNLKYNTTFFWDRKKGAVADIKQDIYFIGKDKGRLKKIKKIAIVLEKQGIKGVYHVVATHKYSLPKKEYRTNIPYSEVQANIAESRAILDVQVSQTAGPSLRALEAIFCQKKLITDDKNVKQFRFYNKNNFFIWGEDSLSDLKSFLDSPMSAVNETDIEYYNVSNWLSRFLID